MQAVPVPANGVCITVELTKATIGKFFASFYALLERKWMAE